MKTFLTDAEIIFETSSQNPGTWWWTTITSTHTAGSVWEHFDWVRGTTRAAVTPLHVGMIRSWVCGGSTIRETHRNACLSAAACIYENIPETGHNPEGCDVSHGTAGLKHVETWNMSDNNTPEKSLKVCNCMTNMQSNQHFSVAWGLKCVFNVKW